MQDGFKGGQGRSPQSIKNDGEAIFLTFAIVAGILLAIYFRAGR